MTKILPLGLLIGSLLLIQCSKDTHEEGDIIYECKYMPEIGNTSTRAASKTLKGHVLFSWKNNENGWNFSIVPNLNVAPARENVNAGNTVSGEECLKNNLGLFAEGEEFLWCRQGCIETPEGKRISLSSPPEDVIDDLMVFCVQMGIQLTLAE